jgi:hypothetical protein
MKISNFSKIRQIYTRKKIPIYWDLKSQNLSRIKTLFIISVVWVLANWNWQFTIGSTLGLKEPDANSIHFQN